MLNFRSRSVLFFSYLILLYGLYFFVITPLLWIVVKPYFTVELAPNASLIYWISAFILFMIILLISIALRNVCCEKKLKPSQLPFYMLARGPRVTITNGADDISSAENSVEFNETTKMNKYDCDLANSDVRINVKSDLKLSTIEIGTQTQPIDLPPDLPPSPLTPREIFFYDMLQNGADNPMSSIQLGETKHVYIQNENTRPVLSKLIDDQDLYKNYNELFKFIHKKDNEAITNTKAIDSKPSDDESVPTETEVIIDPKTIQQFIDNEQQVTQINRYNRVSSREYYFVPQPEQLESGRESLKSEVYIEVADESGKRRRFKKNKKSISDDEFHLTKP